MAALRIWLHRGKRQASGMARGGRMQPQRALWVLRIALQWLTLGAAYRPAVAYKAEA